MTVDTSGATAKRRRERGAMDIEDLVARIEEIDHDDFGWEISKTFDYRELANGLSTLAGSESGRRLLMLLAAGGENE